MLPKTRQELRDIITKLNTISLKADILYVESVYIKSAFKDLIKADYYVAHTGKSHKQLKEEENENN